MSRACLVVVLLGALAAFAASPAAASRPVGYPELITTQHFQIHYIGDSGNPNRILHQKAGDLAALAEQAYSTITGWGYPPPLDDGDGKIDVWVQDLSSSGSLGDAVPDGSGTTSSGWLDIDLGSALSEHVIAHELFHLVEMGIWIPPDGWLSEGAAEWAGFRADGFAATQGSLAAPDMSLDCATNACGNTAYEVGGYSRWAFFEYLNERFGNTIVKEIFDGGAALGNPATPSVTLLSAALTARGATLGGVFTDYTAANVSGNYQITALKGLAPTTYSTTSTGTVTAALPVQRVAVNHLAARYLAFTRGAPASTGPCYAATLSLTVALPSGLGAQPYFSSSSVGSAPVPLTLSGTTASLSVPWDTCSGGPAGYLSLPNPSLASDSQAFTVSGSLSVDTSTPVTSTLPPASLVTGPFVAVPTADVPPALFVYGPQLIRVSPADRRVRLIVFSSGPGKLRAAVGGTSLGSAALRPGNNDVSFRLPRSTIDALRRAAGARSASPLLTLTSLSTQGVTGVRVTRRLVVTPSPRPRTRASSPRP